MPTANLMAEFTDFARDNLKADFSAEGSQSQSCSCPQPPPAVPDERGDRCLMGETVDTTTKGADTMAVTSINSEDRLVQVTFRRTS